MRGEVYFFIIIFLIIIYILFSIFNKKIGKFLSEIVIFKNCKVISKTEIIYYAFLLYVIIFINLILIFKSGFICKFGIIIMFFILGYLFSNFQSFINYIKENYNRALKSLLLTAMYIALIKINQIFIPIITLSLSLLFIICLINYVIEFIKNKNQFSNYTFILSFLWILFVNFSASFILIYNISEVL